MLGKDLKRTLKIKMEKLKNKLNEMEALNVKWKK